MMDQIPLCPIPNFVKISQLPQEYNNLRVLSCMSMAAILVMQPGPFICKLWFSLPKDSQLDRQSGFREDTRILKMTA